MYKIFLIDQESEESSQLQTFLKMCGFAVTCSSGGENILYDIQGAMPDILLIEVDLPEKSGIIILREVKENEALKDIPVILMATELTEELSVLGLSSGANEIVTRPLKMAEVTLKVQNALELSKYRKELLEMNKKLEKEKNRLLKYFSEDLVEKILNEEISTELGGSNVKATILFLDIRNSTGIAENMDPKKFSEFISFLFSKFMEIVFTHKGSVNKLLGDGILATFGAPIPSEEDALNCVRCALDIRKSLEQFNQSVNRNHYLPDPIRIGIGIASGNTFAGNIGSVRRMEYTVMGDPVNLASRLENLTKKLNTDILIDKETYTSLAKRQYPKQFFMGDARIQMNGKGYLNIDSEIIVRKAASVRVRGKQNITEIFTVTAWNDLIISRANTEKALQS